MRLEKGDIIRTGLGDNTVVLDVSEKQAVLFSNHQFVIASGIALNEKTGIFEWDQGRYSDSLKDIANMQNNSFENMKNTLAFLAEYNHSDFVKSIISLETGVENRELLEGAYANYMNDSAMGLIDEQFSYLLDEGIDTVNHELEDRENNKENKVNDSQIDESKQKPKDKTLLNIDGNLVGDIEIKNLRSKDGKEFSVANFAIAQNDKNGDVTFTNCYAYNEKIDQVKGLKKGDFIHVFGKEKITKGNDGKEYMSLKVYSAKLIKAKEQNIMRQSDREGGRTSALGQLKGFKEKMGDKQNVGKDNRNKDAAR